MLNKTLVGAIILSCLGLCSCGDDKPKKNPDDPPSSSPNATVVSICNRSPGVLSAILTESEKVCEQVTVEDLAAITELDIGNLTSVQSGDLNGLVSLKKLSLYFIVEDFPLPADLLMGLTALEELNLSENALTTLPDGFLNLPSLKKVDFSDNYFVPEVEAQLKATYPNIDFTFGG